MMAVAKEAEDEAEKIWLERQGRIKGACNIEGGCMHPENDLRDRPHCLVCKELIHNACANEKKLKDETTAQQCFQRVAR